MKRLYNNIINAIQESLNESLFNDPSDDILDSTDDENILADKITYGFEHHYNELKILFQKDGSLFHDDIIKVCKEVGVKVPDDDKDIWCQSNFCRIVAYNDETHPNMQAIKYTLKFTKWQDFNDAYNNYIAKQQELLDIAIKNNNVFEDSIHLAFVTTYSFPSLFSYDYQDLTPVVKKLNIIFKYKGKFFKHVSSGRYYTGSILVCVDPIKDDLKDIIKQAKAYLEK